MSVIYMDRSSFNSLDENDIKRIYNENKMSGNSKELDDQYIGKHKMLDKVKAATMIETT